MSGHRCLEWAELAALSGGGPVPCGSERYLDAGLRYVIIGTAAVKNPGFLQDACNAFGGHIIVGLDAKDGKSPPTAGARSRTTT